MEGKVLTKLEQLEILRAQVAECRHCPHLANARTQTVFGEGNPDAQVMFVGEAPGADEDTTGKPFVGRAGKLLTQVINRLGFYRKDVYICNVLKCLRYNARVMLEDGSMEMIWKLVRQRYSGKVMSVNAEGVLEARHVVGWHSSPLGSRNVYKLSYHSKKNVGRSKGGIMLTEDHPVLTRRGMVPVSLLEPQDEIATGFGFTPITLQVLAGLILGDGHINAKRAALTFSHCLEQKDYLKFKADLLHDEIPGRISEVSVRYQRGTKTAIQFSSFAHPGLKFIRQAVYKQTKTLEPWLVEHLSELSLAVAFMDDGYMRQREGKQPLAEFAFHDFDAEAIRLIMLKFEKFGLSAKYRRGRVNFDVPNTRLLSKIIGPYICPSMRYKMPPGASPYIPIENHGERFTFYDTVDVQPVDFNGTDKTFYCIDVEENRNFVTAGGVVHNCRPDVPIASLGGNRKPTDAEVQTCIPWLHRQVEIVNPKVIVCLGATALDGMRLSGENISKVRGQTFNYYGLPAIPTYHPAYVLRNPAPDIRRAFWFDLLTAVQLVGLEAFTKEDREWLPSA